MTAAPVTTALTARTREIPPAANLLDAMGRDGCAWLVDGAGFVTVGTAARVAPAHAAATLAAIAVDDPLEWPGTGALAVGALPYDGAGGGELVVPRRVVGVTADGRAWCTEIGDGAGAVERRGEPATGFTVRATSTRPAWAERVRGALAAIEDGRFDKVVLAREVHVEADAPFDARTVVDRLRHAQGGCFVFAAGGFVGATPELLVRRRGTEVLSRPMAGTAPRGAHAAAEAAARARLRASGKEAWEHRLVVDAVTASLRAAGVGVDSVPGPEVAAFGAVLHLATTVRGRLDGATPSALDLALALHPTPAVGGAPAAPAGAWLRGAEGLERGAYGGPVGWVDHRGDGEWAVALRCAELDGNRARLLAGAGIVAGSDPEAEWAETQAKFAPMLAALVQP